jgi:hypothetical protein
MEAMKQQRRPENRSALADMLAEAGADGRRPTARKRPRRQQAPQTEPPRLPVGELRDRLPAGVIGPVADGTPLRVGLVLQEAAHHEIGKSTDV